MEYQELDSNELYRDKSYRFTVDTWRLPDGQEGRTIMLHHPGGVAVLARDERGRIPLVRQFRYAVKQYLLEIPAGKLDKVPGETPEQGALRELKEETGFEADSIRSIGECYPTPGVDTEVLHLYFATVSRQGSQDLDSDEFITLRWVSVEELGDMIASGKVNDAKTIVAYTRARMLGLLG